MVLLLCLIVLCSVVDSARILAVYPTPSISHQVVFRALTVELAKRGHELVVITPNPALPYERSIDNIREIDTKAYRFIVDFFNGTAKVKLKRGVISDVEAMISGDSMRYMLMVMEDIFNNEEVIGILKDKTEKFDLVIAEALTSSHYIFAKIYEAPLISFSSMYGYSELFDITGAVSRHPLLYPHAMRNKFKNLSFYEKIEEIYNEYQIMKVFTELDEMENILLKKTFGKDAPTVNELKDLVSILFLNSFPLFDNNRPVPPNVVYLGALHLQAIKELPKDLKEYLDNSKRGVVYVSLGTNVHPSMMDADLLNAFLDAFRQLPYDILWKFDGDNLQNISDNVRVQKWFPQRDLLVHPKIKVFVTQGGLQSTDEAIDAGVPLVGIPMLADQWYNVNKYVELGIGVQLDALTLTADDIVNGVKTVIGGDRYRENIKRTKQIMFDTPQSPLERAVWWTEYVLRHNGTKHLKSPAANISYAEYFMLDFVLVLIIALVGFVAVLLFIGYYLMYKSNERSKIKSN